MDRLTGLRAPDTDAGPPGREPRFVVAPGMSLKAIFGASEMALREPAFGEVRYLQPDGPHVWVLRVGERDIEIGPSRFTTVEIVGDRAVRIRSTFGLGYAPVTAAAAQVTVVLGRLREAGFLEADVVPPGEIEERVPVEGEVRTCRLRAGEWMGEMRVTRMIEAKSEAGKILGLTEDACLANMTLWDMKGAAAMIG